MDLNREIDRSKYSDEDLPHYPARTLVAHVTMKGIQLGAGLGVALAPVYISRVSPLTAFPLAVMAGLTVSGGFTYKLFLDGKLDVDGVDDRAYRIHKSVSQTKADKYSFVGGLAGATSGVLFGKGKPGATLAFACMGITAGIVAHVVEDNIFKESKPAEP